MNEAYTTLLSQIAALMDGEDDAICAMANVSAAIYDAVPDLNWAGFYRVKGDLLILGPFQGKVACTRIASGKGVCGTALVTGESQLVPDVHAFPGHIACDSASNSEVVVPVRNNFGAITAVLDIDSPLPGRFGAEELALFEEIAALIGQIT